MILPKSEKRDNPGSQGAGFFYTAYAPAVLAIPRTVLMAVTGAIFLRHHVPCPNVPNLPLGHRASMAKRRRVWAKKPFFLVMSHVPIEYIYNVGT